MKINEFVVSEGLPGKNVIQEIDKFVINEKTEVDLVSVEETFALSFRGDLYGLLKKIGVNLDGAQIRFIAKINGYEDSQDYDGTQTTFAIPKNIDQVKKTQF